MLLAQLVKLAEALIDSTLPTSPLIGNKASIVRQADLRDKVYCRASGCLDSTPQNLVTGNLQPGWLCKCSMWARAPVLDSFNACTGPWQCLQRIISPRSVRASYRVHGSQRPRTLTSHSVMTGGFFLVATDLVRCLPTSCPYTFPRDRIQKLLVSVPWSGGRCHCGSGYDRSVSRQRSVPDEKSVSRYLSAGSVANNRM